MNLRQSDWKRPRYSRLYLIGYGTYCSIVAIVVFEVLR